jgi:hypothetical protein
MGYNTSNYKASYSISRTRSERLIKQKSIVSDNIDSEWIW